MTRDTYTMAEDGEPLNAAFSILSHPLRRRILMRIRNTSSQSPGEFQPSEFIRADEPEQETIIQLHHTHLPKLEEVGYIDWDRNTPAVRKGPNYQEIRTLLDVIVDNEDELPFSLP